MSEIGETIRGIFKKGPEKQEIDSAETKAQKAFYQLVRDAIENKPLNTVTHFQPPNNTFDLQMQHDSAVFRTESSIKGEAYGQKFEQRAWNYGCVVRDGSGNIHLYTPQDLQSYDTQRLRINGITSVDDLSLGPSIVEVREVPFDEPLLDWNDPGKTLPSSFFNLDSQVGLERVELTLSQVEVVSGGTPIRGKIDKPAEKNESSVLQGLAPQKI